MPKRVPASRSSSMATPSHSPAPTAASSATVASSPERGFGSSSAGLAGSASGTVPPPSAASRLVMPVKPRAPKAAVTSAGSKVGNLASARSISMGASVRMVATLRLSRASSTCARRFSPILPLTSPAWAITWSRLPYCTMSAAAFLGPMPGTPGMLSEVSPFRP